MTQFWKINEIKRLKEAYNKVYFTYTPHAIAKILLPLFPNRHLMSIDNKINRMIREKELPEPMRINHFDDVSNLMDHFPRFNLARKIKPPVLVLADLHIPFTNITFLNKAVDAAKKQGIDKLAIVGDFFDFNFFSKHRYTGESSQDKIEVELAVAERIMNTLLKHFKEVYFCFAWHDYRITAAMDYGLSVERVVNILDLKENKEKLFVSPYSYAYVGKEWMIVHPSRGRKIKGSTARSLVSRYEKSCIVFHQHYSSFQIDPSGNHLVVDCGDCADHEKMKYTQINATDYPKSDNAYAIIHKDERLELIIDHPLIFQ